jgi:hypothetical protein
MEKSNHIIEEITKLTNTIEFDYPELYVFLEEVPVTITSPNHPQITDTIMQDYLDSLKQFIKHSSKTQKHH